jgi:hypothetical protein
VGRTLTVINPSLADDKVTASAAQPSNNDFSS